jgi:hypothetical protein
VRALMSAFSNRPLGLMFMRGFLAEIADSGGYSDCIGAAPLRIATAAVAPSCGYACRENSAGHEKADRALASRHASPCAITSLP